MVTDSWRQGLGQTPLAWVAGSGVTRSLRRTPRTGPPMNFRASEDGLRAQMTAGWEPDAGQPQCHCTNSASHLRRG